MITLEQYFMGKEKTYSKDLTETVKTNANDLLSRVNNLLATMNRKEVSVSSGWRPESYNATIKGAAKKSNHITGNAIDLKDPDGTIGKWCLDNQYALRSVGLYLEHPAYTKGWCHLQNVAPRSGRQVFNP